MASFSERLKDLRKEQGLKQTELADLLQVSIRTYQYYESGQHVPDFYGLIAIADFFQVSIDFLVGRKDER